MELIKIYQGNVVSARELHEFLEVNTKFSMWIRRMLEYGFEEGKDYLTNPKKVNRQILKEYYLTLSTAKEISMLQRTEKGREARKYFIRCEETLKELTSNKRLEAFAKLEATKERLLKNIQNIGGTESDFIQIDYEGRKVLFNGEPLPDKNLHLVLLKGRDFATEIANLNFQEGIDLNSVEKINKASHEEVRHTIINNTSRKPEEFKPEKNIKTISGGNSPKEKPEE